VHLLPFSFAFVSDPIEKLESKSKFNLYVFYLLKFGKLPANQLEAIVCRFISAII